MINIWENKIKEDNEERKKQGKKNAGEIELPIILPLLVYHDEGKWNIKRTLSAMIPNYKGLHDSLKKYIPDFEYLLFDLSDFNKEDVRLQSETMITIQALSRARHASKKEAIEILIEAIKLIDEMEKIAEKISIEGGELVMSVAERLRQEGIEEGIEKGIKRTAKTMIIDGEPIDRIIRYTGLTKEDIAEIKEEMLN